MPRNRATGTRDRVAQAVSRSADRLPPERERTRLLSDLATADSNVVLEIGGHDIALTHLDRVYWPAVPAPKQAAITKRDFIRYLIGVAPAFLEHVADRPLTLFRWPEGIAAKRVLMKHWEIKLPAFVERVTVFSETKGETDEYILCNNLATLVWLGHMGTLEFHVWHSRVRPGPDAPDASADFSASSTALQKSIVNFPDYILFDIDPFIYSGAEAKGNDPELNVRAFERAKQVALWLKALLDGMSLASRVKTSGKTGLHVVVPIRRTLRYDAVREIARSIGDHLMREHRDDITVDWTVERRTGKVFIDYNMNVRGKSMTAPYSPRGLAGAPVSMPLGWRQLESAYPADFRLTTVLPLLRKRGDPWSGLFDDKQSIEERLSVGR